MPYEFFVSENLLPKGFQYPESYKNIVNGLLPDINPWMFFSKYLDFRFKGLKERYPNRIIVPFARRGDTDDVACFEAEIPSDNPSVINIHDWADAGYEGRRRCKDFSEWLDIVLFLNQSLE